MTIVHIRHMIDYDEIKTRTSITMIRALFMYSNKVPVLKISKILKMTRSDIYNTVAKYRITVKHQYGSIKDLKISGASALIKDKIKNKFFYVKECPMCNNDVHVEVGYVRKMIANDTISHWMCRSCWEVDDNSSDSNSMKNKYVNNSTGFIGVSRINKSNKPHGIRTQVDHKSKVVFVKKFHDEEMSEETILKAATMRDLYIRKNKLPHTRNFSNENLDIHVKRFLL